MLLFNQPSPLKDRRPREHPNHHTKATTQHQHGLFACGETIDSTIHTLVASKHHHQVLKKPPDPKPKPKQRHNQRKKKTPPTTGRAPPLAVARVHLFQAKKYNNKVTTDGKTLVSYNCLVSYIYPFSHPSTTCSLYVLLSAHAHARYKHYTQHNCTQHMFTLCFIKRACASVLFYSTHVVHFN